MISRYSYLLYIAILSFALVGVCSSSLSLWFLRGVLGTSRGVVEIGYQDALLTTKAIGSSVVTMSDSYMGFSLPMFSRLVYVRDRSQEYVVGIPRLSYQLKLQGVLTDSGWSTSRIGWMIVGKRLLRASVNEKNDISNQRDVSVISGFKEEFIAIFRQDLSANPAFFIRTIPGFASIENGMAMYGTLEKNVFHGVISYTADHYIKGSHEEVVRGGEDINGLNVTIQSELFESLPSEFTAAIDSKIAQDFHFTNTNPAIADGARSNGAIGFFSKGSEAAIGVNMNADDFLSTFSKYIQSEQGARHPQRKGFLLPDGTVGHEYVPSVPTIHFEKIEDSRCQKISGYDDQLFVCKDSATAATIGTSIHAAQSLMKKINEGNYQVRGSVAGDFLRKIIPGNSFQKFTFTGNENGLNFWGIY